MRAEFQQNVSAIVRMLMGRDGLNHTRLADEIGYTQPAVSDKLAGRRKWNIEDLWLLAEYFDVDVSLFFEEPEDLMKMRWFSATGVSGEPAILEPLAS